jgi:hypothetical protein
MSVETKRAKCDSKFHRGKVQKTFYEIIDNLIDHLSACFSSTVKMEFFSLLHCQKSDTYKFKATFPEELL